MIRTPCHVPRLRLVALVAAVLLVPFALGPNASPQPSETLLVGLDAGADEAPVRAVLAGTGARLSGRIDALHVVIVEVGAGARSETVRRLLGTAGVRYAEPDQPLVLTGTPDDPMYLDGKQWNLDKIEVFKAWELLPAAPKTIVGVLDSGIDSVHPDLAAQVLPLGCDAQFRAGCSEGDRTPRDIGGHGSHVAGIIGAAANNGVGVASVGGDRVSILVVRLSPNASGLIDGVKALEAIVYAVNKGAKVLNLSFGGACGARQSDPWRDAVDYAHNRDVLMVVAAGNDSGCDEGRYPANDPRVLSVAAVDREGFLAPFSTRGPWVSVAAPGVAIWSTYRDGGYASLSGTSMAAPHVSALAAMLFGVPGATKAKVMEWIKSTCDGTVAGNQCGGTINAYRAV